AQLAATLGAARRVYGVHAEPVPVMDGPGVRAGASASRGPALELSQVTFTYPGRRRPALVDVSFSVPRGGGKTTIPSLCLRFWDPDMGAIRLDGHDLREYGLDELRRRVALVAQD